MTNAPIVRNDLTMALLTFLLEIDGIEVGRGTAPKDGGYVNGSTGTFTAYAVIKTGRAVTPAPNEPERFRARTSWQLDYQITYHEVTEDKVERLAQLGREKLVDFAGPLALGGVDWELQRIWIPRLGGIDKDDSTDPAHQRLTDDVSLHVSRAQTR